MKTATFTENDFHESLISGQPILVNFTADWCPSCKAMLPVVDSLSEDFKDRVTILKVNVDDNPSLASDHNIKSIPSFLFFKNGKLVDRVVGPVLKMSFEKKLQNLL